MQIQFRISQNGWLVWVTLIGLFALAACTGNPLGMSGPRPDEGRPDLAAMRADRPVSIKLNPTPAPELPQRPPDLIGTVLSVEDNTLLVDSSSISISSAGDTEEIPGPTVEVAVTRDTQVYKLRMAFEQNREFAEPGVSDELVPELHLQVWGHRTGDRVVAEVLAYVGEGAIRFQSSDP